MANPAITVSLQALRDLLIEEVRFISGVSDQVEEVERDLKTIHSFLIDADRFPNKYNPASLRDCIANLNDLASKAENILEKYAIKVSSNRESGVGLMKKFKRYTCILCEWWSIHQTGRESEAIRSRFADLTARFQNMARGESSSSDAGQHLLRLTYPHQVEEHFVGMEKDVEHLLCLVKDDKSRSNRVIATYGMGGLGKTTLARKIYQHEDVKRAFKARAWVCVTQQFQAKTVLQQILKKILPDGENGQIEAMEQSDLVEQLHNFQMEQKCLIVIDDIWEKDHWDILKPAFPIGHENCKVLLTTRNEKVALGEYLHKLDYLTEDQGWELLRKKALPRDYEQVTGLEQLKSIGTEMVRKCGRLPLAISVIGGSLRGKQTLGEWQRVNDNLNSYLKHGEGVENDKKVKQVLDLSYDILPYYLKRCFLYLGFFREDEEIDTERLYSQWMAEGLIASEDKGREETLRDVAQRYLSELAFRCMVQVEKHEFSSAYNKYKSCRLHDLMRDLCLSKCEEEGFLKLVDFSNQRNCSVGTTSRLAIHFDGAIDDYLNKREKFKHLRSLLLLQKDWKRASNFGSKHSVTNFNKLNSLRILMFEHCEFEDELLPTKVGELIHLRYLSLFGSKVNELPSSVCYLPYLQTLDLRALNLIKIPNVIYKMKRLKHLFFGIISTEDEIVLDGLTELETLQGFDSKLIRNSCFSTLTNLQSLSAKVYRNYALSMIVDHMSNNHGQLRETHVRVSSCDFSLGEGSNVFKKLLMSRSLITLELRSCGVFRFPSYQQGMCTNLIELTVSSSTIEGDLMGVLGKFPMLKSLNLFGGGVVDKQVICRATSPFPELRFLKLSYLLNLEKWEVEKGAMPNLSTLQISSCEKLEMIPDGLRFITTLQELRTEAMPKKFNNRIRVVNDQQGEDYHKVCHVPFISLDH